MTIVGFDKVCLNSLLYTFLNSSSGVTVILSLGNPAGYVSEDNGAMLVLVELVGKLSSDVAVTVHTYDGSGLFENVIRKA